MGTRMRFTALRWVIATIVVAVAFAGGVGRALGISVGPVSTPSVPSAPPLQPPADLPSTPPVSTPSVPPVSTPSVPPVHTPAVDTPSVPSVHAPAAPWFERLAEFGRAQRLGALQFGARGLLRLHSVERHAIRHPRRLPTARPQASLDRAATDVRPVVVAHRHRYERRLRSQVKREQACLGSLPARTRQLLGLRAGLSGAPRTRAEAATELGISVRSAARLERSGLRELHVACGGATAPGSGGGRSGAVNARFVTLASHAPALQPAAYLPMSNAPDLQRPRGQGEVQGATATSSPQPSRQAPRLPPGCGIAGRRWSWLPLGALRGCGLGRTRRPGGRHAASPRGGGAAQPDARRVHPSGRARSLSRPSPARPQRQPRRRAGPVQVPVAPRPSQQRRPPARPALPRSPAPPASSLQRRPRSPSASWSGAGAGGARRSA